MKPASSSIRSRLVAVSESPSPNTTSLKLEGRTALRLARMMGLESTEEMESLIVGRNLLPTSSPWRGTKELRAAAEELLPRISGSPILFLGIRTTLAFALMPRPFFTWRIARSVSGSSLLYASIPHPSVVNRTWNDHATYAAACRFLESVAADVLSGELAERAEALAAESALRLPKDELLGYQDAAAWFGVYEETIRRWVADGSITHVRLGPREVRFRWVDLHAYAAERVVEARPRARPDADSLLLAVDPFADEARRRLGRRRLA